MRGRLILSLCDFTGNWARPYADAGYGVRLVDLKRGQDVRLMERPDEPVHGILAAPPCTVFANSGARWPRTEAEMREGLSIVDACLRLVAVCRPTWWALENPVGKLSRYLGPPAFRFHPWQYGDPYTKLTCLWGCFTPPLPLFHTQKEIEPAEGSRMHLLPGATRHDSPAVAEKKRAARSVTPEGFARAFFEANP